MGRVDVNGVSTHFQRLAARPSGGEPVPTVVFVHGLGYDSLASFYLTLAAPFAEHGIDVLTYDLRGHGRSARPATGYRVSDFVADLRGLLAELAEDRPVHVIGNSFGGTIAFSFAATHPERVSSVVAIEGEPATQPWADKMERTFGNVLDEARDPANIEWLERTYGKHHARLATAALRIIESTSIVADVPSGPLLGEQELRALHCPVMTVVGSDGFQRDDPYALQAVLPSCRTEVINDQDHSVLVERHHLLRYLLLNWVTEQEHLRWLGEVA
ncbi:alpha/beta hydrolase fold [Haloechinothrix alba]|uniref:Alpha/beta hydrolase fold n=1 Tax=Haloechinothrix alba TaxID=664784 RepID=A0A238VFN5_9PSEU|nr:alpha/beta hydrolase [Haloechinothrix alba]SNR33202.1 alpha/beta hydrolase fold [Haloechinothrix alba]